MTVMTGTKPPVMVTGMYGLGDNIHQRAIIRELMKTNEVWLRSYYGAIFHDFIDEGLHVIPHLGPAPRISEGMRPKGGSVPPAHAAPLKVSYHPADVRMHGSIMRAQFASVGLPPVAEPDFSLPIPQNWRSNVRRMMAGWPIGGRPIAIYRPIVLNKVWECPARAPDPAAYAALFAPLRERYFVVSVADLRQREHIVGPEQDADVKLHQGELNFETLAALFAESELVFCCPGFSPVLAQAVGAKTIIVYGGHESSRTASAGDHLAPTLHIDLDKPCECHNPSHACDKRITIEPARQRIEKFIGKGSLLRRNLIFAATFVADDARARLMEHWLRVTLKLNPECDILLVDTPSETGKPSRVPDIAKRFGDLVPHVMGDRARLSIKSFDDNIGHLGGGAHKDFGRDGWGRAFTYGLEAAIAGNYEFAAHIEGDSIFRLPVKEITAQMERDKTVAASMPVRGMKTDWPGWVETGLMFFRTEFLEKSGFIASYNWQGRPRLPAPEVIIHNLLGDKLRMLPLSGRRDDRNEITAENVAASNLDWLTHCADAGAYEKFAAAILDPLTVKINLGCGGNRLKGWQNYDREVDIGKALTLATSSIDILFCEHCVEHIDYYAAIEFFKECRRVLKHDGVLRVVVPSIEQILKSDAPDYFDFTTRWQKVGPTARGAMHAILYAHGHKTAWTSSLLEATLYFAGFDKVTKCTPHESQHTELKDVEGHHKVIGERFNTIESLVFEAH